MGSWRRLLGLVNGLAMGLLALLAVAEGADRASKRGYEEIVSLTSAEEGVDADLVRAIIAVESRFDPNAVSRKGAKGLMQLMPGTAARYAVGDPFDPEANIRGGVRYLRFLQELFPGRLPWVLAAYNAGENAVLRHNGVPPYRETREYVDRVLDRYGRREVGADSRAAERPHPPAAPAQAQDPPSAPRIFRVEGEEVVLYTNVVPARLPALRTLQRYLQSGGGEEE